MNVGDLKKMLEGVPDDMPVVLQRDAEGNGYSILAGATNDGLIMDDSCVFDMEVFGVNWTAEDADMEEEEWEHYKKSNKRCFVLWPV